MTTNRTTGSTEAVSTEPLTADPSSPGGQPAASGAADRGTSLEEILVKVNRMWIPAGELSDTSETSRLPVPGGWLYRTIAGCVLPDRDGTSDWSWRPVSVCTTYVPDPEARHV